MSTTRKGAASGTAKAGAAESEAPDRAEIEAQIERIRADIGDLAQLLKAAGGARLKEAREGAELLPEEALAELQAQLLKLEAEARARVSAQPFQSLGLAALAGFLLGLLLRR